MRSNTPLDYAVFQLSPRRSRCELFVSGKGNTEKLASGLLKPFIAHLKVAEEQVGRAVQSIKLAVDRNENSSTWFTKGTLERFVRFVSTPEVLELVNTFDAEMSHLETARKIYAQGSGNQLSATGGSETTAADITKRELLRAIDVRLHAVQQDLTAASNRAVAAGFTLDSTSELLHFSEVFGAHRLKEACLKFMSLCQRRPGLICPWPNDKEQVAQSPSSSDMSIDDSIEESVKSDKTFNTNQLNHDKRQPNLALRSVKDESNQNDESPHIESKPTSDPSQPTRLVKRLSVQDRINLFENKQKEQSSKTELRRLSSEVSAERAILRRWSGTSDMSIELSNEKESEGTSTSPSISQSHSRTFSKRTSESGLKDTMPIARDEQSDYQDRPLLSKLQGSKLDEQTSFSNHPTEPDFNDTKIPRFHQRSLSRSTEISWLKDQESAKNKVGEVLSDPNSIKDDQELGNGEPRARIYSQSQNVLSVQNSHDEQVKNVKAVSQSQLNRKEGKNALKKAVGVQGHPESRDVLQNPPKFSLTKMDIVSASDMEAPQFKSVASKMDKAVEVDQLNSQSQGGTFSSQKHFENSTNFKGHESNNSGFNIHEQILASPPNMEVTDMIEEARLVYGNKETSLENVLNIRPLKGHQELNDELKMKANELERLFAVHKLRVPSDLTGLVCKSKLPSNNMERKTEISSTEMPGKDMMKGLWRSSSNGVDFDTNLLVEMVDNLGCSNSPHLQFGDPGSDSRGKFYEKYMQRRDAKLREEWNSNRAQKEAKLKAMQDDLEFNRAEMRSKFSKPINKEDSTIYAHRRTERMKSFNVRTTKKNKEPLTEPLEKEKEKDAQVMPESTPCRHVRSLSETFIDDGSLTNIQSKKLLIEEKHSSSTPRSSAGTSLHSSVKSAKLENPLMHSVSNFSDFRKENTKPLMVSISKPSTRTQYRNYPHGRNTNDDNGRNTNDDKPQRSQSMRKESFTPTELKNLSSSLNSDSTIRTRIKLSKEQIEPSVPSKISKNTSGIVNVKASAYFDNLKGELNESEGGAESDYEIGNQALKATVLPSDFEHERPMMSQESDKSDLETESNEVLRSFLKENYGESPISSQINHSFSSLHEASDLDVSVDSPLGSPASWNSHSLPQILENEVARTRKKWATTQISNFMLNSSHRSKDSTKGFKRLLKIGRNGRGFESVITTNWASVITSDGDDDTEVSHDISERLSSDCRKSRNAFSQANFDCLDDYEIFDDQVQSLHGPVSGPPSDEHLSGSSLRATRNNTGSFFSLSSFRSKGVKH